MPQLSAITMQKVNEQKVESAAVEEKLVGLFRSLNDAEMRFVTLEMVERVRRAATRHRNKLSAYRVELSESRRILAESEAALEKERETEKRALKSRIVDDIAEVQRRIAKLEDRRRSYEVNIPSIEATIAELEAEEA